MRPSRDEWAMNLAIVTAQRATCLRRRVGAVLLNERGHVLATGFNGVAAGQPHCNEVTDHIDVTTIEEREVDLRDNPDWVFKPQRLPEYKHACSGAHAASGTNLDGCEAIHAEQNAMLQCKNVFEIHTAYVTASPCITCCKLLMNTSCQRIVFLEEYPHTQARDLWVSSGRAWEQIDRRRLLVHL